MLVAVDTNVLIDQALDDENVIEAIALIRKKLGNVTIIVTPTVLHELAWAVDNDDDQEIRDAASRALQSLHEWGYEPLNVVPVGNGIVEQISLKLRMKGIIPEEEQNDASVVAEAALIGAQMLLSSDQHLIGAQENEAFGQTLKDFDVGPLTIARPSTITRMYR